ncbi:gamma-glutamyltransferase family protein [Henriciella aquimarina]|uniref:gamma-glutamyltransferase family protein n=1 Tax=Henriciella aquimarina TaxID=545261 RepID=UPI000A05C904|nr:gamma-glutamyltransferase family protein [Henriciella aquimarina]
MKFSPTMKAWLLSGLASGLIACAAAPAQAQEASPPEAAAEEDVAYSEPGPGDRMPSGRDYGVRSAVVAPHAAAATAHPLATQTALDTMKAGGNAVDAAIAANAMLGLVEPTANGIGGDLFAIVWDPQTETLYGYNSSGRSAQGATLEDIQAKADEYMEGEEIPPYGATPVTVPGTVDGWFALHDKFGTKDVSTLVAPAVKYAREGAPIPEVIAYYWQRSEKNFEKYAESGMIEEFDNARETYFSPTPREGSLFKNPDLADTLETIGAEGRDAFYKGEIAHTMADYFERIGGFLTYEDFASHEGEWVDPICVPYRDEVKVCELPPNTQGIAALQMLQMLERFNLSEMGYGSPDSLVAQIEAKRLAFADRAKGYADPAFSGIDPEVFVREGYNAERSKLIDIDKPMATVDPGMDFAADAKLEDGDTTYLTVTDENGMMVSLIQSNYRGMGSGLVADGLGFMFQDRGQLFSLDPAHPNAFEPGKRPFHTIIPAFAFRKDMPGCQVRAEPIEQACPYEPWMSFGLMGGGMQPQGHTQIIVNLIDFGMGLQEAGDAARWEHTGGCEPTDAYTGDACEQEMGTVHLESGIPPETRAELERRGYTVECCEANGGGYQAIMRDFESGAWIAATEMRKDGDADGF